MRTHVPRAVGAVVRALRIREGGDCLGPKGDLYGSYEIDIETDRGTWTVSGCHDGGPDVMPEEDLADDETPSVDVPAGSAWRHRDGDFDVVIGSSSGADDDIVGTFRHAKSPAEPCPGHDFSMARGEFLSHYRRIDVPAEAPAVAPSAAPLEPAAGPPADSPRVRVRRYVGTTEHAYEDKWLDGDVKMAIWREPRGKPAEWSIEYQIRDLGGPGSLLLRQSGSGRWEGEWKEAQFPGTGRKAQYTGRAEFEAFSSDGGDGAVVLWGTYTDGQSSIRHRWMFQLEPDDADEEP